MLKKRGISAWLSWVLMMGLAVALGAFFFGFARDYATSSAEDARFRGETRTSCDNSALLVKGICQNAQALNINISNVDALDIEAIAFRITDIFDNPELRQVNETLRPNEERNFRVVRQGTAKQVEVIPVVSGGGRDILCEERKVIKNDIKFCLD